MPCCQSSRVPVPPDTSRTTDALAFERHRNVDVRDEATNPATWAHQIRATVRFSDELDVLLADPSRVLVEVGPGGTLTASAMRHPRWSSGHRAVRLMRHQAQNRNDHDTFLLALGQLWSADVDVDWAPLSAGHRPRRVSLPGYPFERQGIGSSTTQRLRGPAMPWRQMGRRLRRLRPVQRLMRRRTARRRWKRHCSASGLNASASAR